jgi:hypothetical protein
MAAVAESPMSTADNFDQLKAGIAAYAHLFVVAHHADGSFGACRRRANRAAMADFFASKKEKRTKKLVRGKTARYWAKEAQRLLRPASCAP